jgi:hypothetical protein
VHLSADRGCRSCTEDGDTLQNREDKGGGGQRGCKMVKTRRKGPHGLLTGD